MRWVRPRVALTGYFDSLRSRYSVISHANVVRAKQKLKVTRLQVRQGLVETSLPRYQRSKSRRQKKVFILAIITFANCYNSETDQKFMTERVLQALIFSATPKTSKWTSWSPYMTQAFPRIEQVDISKRFKFEVAKQGKHLNSVEKRVSKARVQFRERQKPVKRINT